MTPPRELSCDPITGVQLRIGVMGSASEPADPAVGALCRRLGRTVAERGVCLLTGACPGLPHEAVLGAKEAAGHVVGISPAATLREHAETSLRIYGEEIPVRAHVETVHGLSAHADADGLMRWLRTASRPPKRALVVHGDPGPAQALATRIEKELGWAVSVPAYRDRVAVE
jgi:hypothetical protein